MNKFHTKQQAETENISSSGIHYLYPQRQDSRPPQVANDAHLQRLSRSLRWKI